MRMLRIVALLAVGTLVLPAAAALFYLDHAGIGPRALANYLAPQKGETNGLMLRGGHWAQAALLALDAGRPEPIDPDRLSIGAHGVLAAPAKGVTARAVGVATPDELRRAIDHALPGDLITLAAGTYHFSGGVAVRRAGSAAANIIVRGVPGAVIEFDTVEGFAVSAPFWRFERLSVRGVCSNHSNCEHAFHVVGGAHHFSAVGNTIVDFNAHFKINGVDGRFPDHGSIEANTLTNNTPRRTANPVTPIDLVAASHWTIRRNFIADFIKQGGDQISYGAYAKGGGGNNAFEQNIVWCERLLRDHPGQRIGMSLGGGGTGAAYCRDGKCNTEQDDSSIVANLIASCSDDGVYVNSAAHSRVIHNTLVGTGGIALRFASTSAQVEGNLADGPIQVRDGAILRAVDNSSAPITYRYAGQLVQRLPLSDSLAWIGTAPRRASMQAIPPDLCGGRRPTSPAYGAFEDFSACRVGAASK